MKNTDYNKLKGLAKYISNLIETGKWNSLDEKQRISLKNTLNQLISRVQRFIAKRKLLRALGAAAVLVSAKANAQSFADPVINPFGIGADTYFSKPEFVDLDGDGDLDFFHSYADEALFYYQENTGTASAPDFAEAVTNPFELTSTTPSYMPIFGDLDNDGDFDMISSSYEEGSILFYENIGTATEPEFTDEVSMPFGITTIYNLPSDLVDIDDDGDLDLFTSKYDEVTEEGKIFFFENTGTPEAPAFAAPIADPFGMTIGTDDYFSFVDFADFDDDGDLDFMRTQMYGQVVHYHENIGDAETPEFEAGEGLTSPFDIAPLTGEQYFMAPSLVDIDADGDIDLFVSAYDEGMTFFFKNKSNTAGITDNTPNHEITVYPNPARANLTLRTGMMDEAVSSIRVITIDGQVIYQSNTLVNEINVADFPAGMYVLEINTIDGEQSKAGFIKQ